ncbi:MAG: sulfotransferase, partial [Waterburya sp.]
NPVEFLETCVFREMPINVKAVGFKLFYYHAQAEKTQKIWQYLQDYQELKIIHLVRKNLLQTYVSQQIALATNSWYLKSGKQVKNNPAIALDYEQTRKAFEETKKLEAENDTFFQNHQVIKVFYEDLVKDNLAEIAKIQNFLNVKPTPVNISTKKRSPQSLQPVIQNYSELKASFQESPYITFFE